MPFLFALTATAHAACPPTTAENAMSIAQGLLGLAASGEAGPWNDRVSEPLQFDAIIDGADDPQARLETFAIQKTGVAPGDGEAGFMDVAIEGSEVWFYLQPDRAAVIDSDRHVTIRKPKAKAEYYQICGDLHQAWQAARARGIDQQIAAFEPGVKAAEVAVAPAPEPPRKSTVSVGLAAQYSFALGPTQAPVVASAVGGQGYFDVELNPAFAVRTDIRYNRAESISGEIHGASGTMTTSGLRFSPEARLQFPVGPLGFQASLGPAFGIYSLCGKVGGYTFGCDESGTQLLFGGHASVQATWRRPGASLGLYFGPDAEVYVRPTDSADPVVEVGLRLGVTFGRKQEVARAR